MTPRTATGRKLVAIHGASFLDDVLGIEQEAAALVRTPETLDVERLAMALSEYEDGDTRRPSARLMARLRPTAERLASIYNRLAATPSPTPPEGLREAAERAADFLTMLGGEWKAKYGEPVTIRTPGEVVAALRAALAPSAEPPETT